MKAKSRFVTYVAAVSLITMAMTTSSWSQDDSSTTTVSSPKPSPDQKKKPSNTAKFETKPGTDDSKSNTGVGKRLKTSASVSG